MKQLLKAFPDVVRPVPNGLCGKLAADMEFTTQDAEPIVISNDVCPLD
ncbi:MAG: hypothetical protein IH961_08335 [Chloroflexi bacterium]|nr:hypothetical protein [Chloroflexota bacterium]